ncbi:MAG: amidohydrolase family protein, partial [Actinobacteria bacterium]|nr:amidohydrolase family protein [Actinomycetota bacterium]
FYIDALIATDGAAVANWPVLNNDFAAIEEQLKSPSSIIGLADSGAHATQIMDASQPTFFLSYWIRDRGVMSLEEGVRRITSDTANFIGFADRGVLRPGAYADVNVLDYDNLGLPVPEMVRDFPGGSPRFIQRAHGVSHTIVNGAPFMEAGEHTGAVAGRLLRT